MRCELIGALFCIAWLFTWTSFSPLQISLGTFLLYNCDLTSRNNFILLHSCFFFREEKSNVHGRGIFFSWITISLIVMNMHWEITYNLMVRRDDNIYCSFEYFIYWLLNNLLSFFCMLDTIYNIYFLPGIMNES